MRKITKDFADMW